MKAEKNKQMQAAPEKSTYEAAVARFQQACEEVKEKKRAVYDAFRKSEKIFKDGDHERVRRHIGEAHN